MLSLWIGLTLAAVCGFFWGGLQLVTKQNRQALSLALLLLGLVVYVEGTVKILDTLKISLF